MRAYKQTGLKLFFYNHLVVSLPFLLLFQFDLSRFDIYLPTYHPVILVPYLLPGIVCAVAVFTQHNEKQKHYWSFLSFKWRTCFKVLFPLFSYPVWMLVLGWKTLRNIPDVRMLVHAKAWTGLFYVSSEIFWEIVYCQETTLPAIRQDLDLDLDNRIRFPFPMFRLCSFLITVTQYHVLLDGKTSQECGRILKLAPFFAVNVIFRCVTLSLFYIYWEDWVLLACAPLVLSNMWLTRKTLMDVNMTGRVNQHLTFCWMFGGLGSLLCPALVQYYGQTANKKTINYYYKRNILATNILLITIFCGLILHLNLTATDGNYYVNRNILLGCHDVNTNYTMEELQIDDETLYLKAIHLFQSQTQKPDYRYQFPYVVPQDCGPNQSPVDMFNLVAVPVTCILWVISSLTSLCTFYMD